MTLLELPMGTWGVIQSVGGTGNNRIRLLEMGLVPGTHICMVRIAPFGDPVQVSLRGYALTLRRADAEKITVCAATDAPQK